MPLAPGEKLGPYEILALIGKGGMGEVYRAHDSRLRRDVAIKVSNAEFTERFTREARTIASLNHTNICHLYDVGPNYLVMEYVEGDTLKGPLDFDDALPIIQQLIDGIEAAHEKNIIHRDLKPANIKITLDGVVKILDFGLAKAMEPPPSTDGSPDNSPTLTMGMTEAGSILGTAAYMSPEQAKGKIADRRADVWSFGIVLYELLAGKKLFSGESVVEILGGVLNKEPDLSAAPPRVHKLLRWCLEKDRKQRLQAIGDARRLLTDERDSTTQPAPPPRTRFGWIAWGVAGVATTVALALAFVHFGETPPNPRVVRATIPPPLDSAFNFAGSRALPAISPDGLRIVFGSRMKDGKSQLWIRPLNSLAAQPLVGTEDAIHPFWSPDSRFIGFFADGRMKKIDTQGGPPLALADASLGRGGSWSPEGVIVFAPTGNGGPLLRISESGGSTSPVTALDQARGETLHKLPWFLPDGHHFLYETQGSGQPDSIRIASIDSKGSDSQDSKVIIEGTGSNALYAEGRLLFLREQTLMAQPFDLERLATAGEAVPLAEHVQSVMNNGPAGFFSASANGLMVYQAGQLTGAYQLTWFDRAGKKLGTLGGPSDIRNIEFSPDRKRVGVNISGEGNAGEDVWFYDAERGIRSRFTFDVSDDRSSNWSTDGSMIIFDSFRKGHRDFYRRPSDASATEQPLYADDSDKASTSWSPDGRFLLYHNTGPSKTGRDLWVLPLTPKQGAKGVEPKPFAFLQTPFMEYYGKFSPDGRWVTYVSNESGSNEIYVAAFPGPGGKQQISIEQGSFPRWRSDGKEIFYVGLDQRLMAAEVTARGDTIEVGQVRPLFGPVVTTLGYLYDVSADGQKFLLAVPPEQTTSEPLTLLENWAALLGK